MTIDFKKVEELKKELDSLRPISKEDELRIMQKFRLDWNYHSNNLEGNSLTYGETKALIMFGVTAQGKPLKDHFEIRGHDEAVKWVTEIVKQDRPITENFIRELHQLLLKESYEVDAVTPDGLPTKKRIKVGEYKTSPNHVLTKTGEIFRFASPEETPGKMHDLLEWYRQKNEDPNYNKVLLAAEFHYKYIRIHPFDDGNGRTARILMNLILMQAGYPPVIVKTDDKHNYFAALRQADAGILKPFIDYISNNLISSLNIMISGAKGESIEENDDLDKEVQLLYKEFESLGKDIKIQKNKETLLELYDKSIAPLADKFFEKGDLFKKFYIKTNIYFFINGGAREISREKLISERRENINGDTKDIKFNYNYETLNQIGLEHVNTTSVIQIFFSFTGYKIRNSQKQIIEKVYGEFLNDDETNEIVNSEFDIHKRNIKKYISEKKSRT